MKRRPIPDVVIVVDMQRGFLEEGNSLYCGDEARRIIPRLQRLLDEQLKKGSALIFTADIKTIEGKPVAKRGRIPGDTNNPRLEKVNLALDTKHE